MKYLLDTNICIYIINKKPSKVVEKFKKFKLEDIGISSVSVAELTYGIYKSKYYEDNKKALAHFLSPFEVVSFDLEAANVFGKIRTIMEKKGNPIGPMDFLIASIALNRQLTLITNNVREFSKVPGLKTINWAE